MIHECVRCDFWNDQFVSGNVQTVLGAMKKPVGRAGEKVDSLLQEIDSLPDNSRVKELKARYMAEAEEKQLEDAFTKGFHTKPEDPRPEIGSVEEYLSGDQIEKLDGELWKSKVGQDSNSIYKPIFVDRVNAEIIPGNRLGRTLVNDAWAIKSSPYVSNEIRKKSLVRNRR